LGGNGKPGGEKKRNKAPGSWGTKGGEKTCMNIGRGGSQTNALQTWVVRICLWETIIKTQKQLWGKKKEKGASKNLREREI